MDEREGEISRIPSKIFCLIVPKNAVEEPFSLSNSFGYRRKLDERLGGVSRYSVENSLSHSAENLRRGTLPCCCFSKFLVAKKFMDKTGGGECQDFPSNFFCFTVPKNIVEEPFRAVVSVNLW